MKVARTRWTTALAALSLLVLTACGSGGGNVATGDDAGAGGTGTEGAGTAGTEQAAGGDGGEVEGKVAVLLPDSASSSRWETKDRPFFEEAFQELGLSPDQYQILNAEGDAATQQTQAEQAITEGATVLLMTNLDSGSGATIIDNAKAQGVRVIDYDRLTLDGDADYYVSFNNEEVGRLQGEGLVQCLEEEGVEDPNVAVLNGSPTDNNATLFAQGYNSVIDPKFESGEWTEVDDQSVPDWDNQQALTIFEQMLEQAGDDIDGVLAANDGLGNAAISALKTRDLNGIPVTGQDATPEGIQNILLGDQCMTVYKSIREEARAAAELAVGLLRGEEPQADDVTNNGTKDVPSVLLTPESITIDNVQTVVDDGFLTVEEICTGDAAQTDFCKEQG